MTCETCREALSARLDGEAEPPGADEHLAECAACRAWQAGAAALTRSLRVREAVAVPDLTDAVLAAVPRREPAGRRRLALGAVAVAQLTLGMAQLLGVSADPHAGHTDPAATAHLLNESSAWTIALGVGLAWAAFRPAMASGVLVVVTGFLAVLTPFAVADLVTGTATASRVATHAILLPALGLLLALRRGARLVPPLSQTLGDEPAEPSRDDGRTRLRPVSRTAAA